MKVLNVLMKLLIAFLLVFQYFMSMIFKSDIPMNILDGDIGVILFIAFLIQLIIIVSTAINRNEVSYGLLVLFLLSLMIWGVDTINLMKLEGYKAYSLNAIGIYTSLINILYICIAKLQSEGQNWVLDK